MATKKGSRKGGWGAAKKAVKKTSRNPKGPKWASKKK